MKALRIKLAALVGSALWLVLPGDTRGNVINIMNGGRGLAGGIGQAGGCCCGGGGGKGQAGGGGGQVPGNIGAGGGHKHGHKHGMHGKGGQQGPGGMHGKGGQHGKGQGQGKGVVMQPGGPGGMHGKGGQFGIGGFGGMPRHGGANIGHFGGKGRGMRR